MMEFHGLCTIINSRETIFFVLLISGMYVPSSSDVSSLNLDSVWKFKLSLIFFEFIITVEKNFVFYKYVSKMLGMGQYGFPICDALFEKLFLLENLIEIRK